VSDPGPAVRPATRADVEILVEFNRAMARETERLELDPDVLRRGVRAVLDDPRRGFYRLAERGGEVAGGLMVTFEWSDWRAGDVWWIQSVYVAPDHRRRGVYRALYAAVLDEARDAGARGLRLYVAADNAAARRVYGALGMEPSHYRLYEAPLDPAGLRARASAADGERAEPDANAGPPGP
jgi:GNAT superfamily N-acetyltransferase